MRAPAISANALTKLGVGDVVEADGGAAAILALLSQPFNLMLMDWYMPDVSGAGVMTVLRDARVGAADTTPVILMTAYASGDNIARARDLGPTTFWSSPSPATSWAWPWRAPWARLDVIA